MLTIKINTYIKQPHYITKKLLKTYAVAHFVRNGYMQPQT